MCCLRGAALYDAAAPAVPRCLLKLLLLATQRTRPPPQRQRRRRRPSRSVARRGAARRASTSPCRSARRARAPAAKRLPKPWQGRRWRAPGGGYLPARRRRRRRAPSAAAAAAWRSELILGWQTRCHAVLWGAERCWRSAKPWRPAALPGAAAAAEAPQWVLL